MFFFIRTHYWLLIVAVKKETYHFSSRHIHFTKVQTIFYLTNFLHYIDWYCIHECICKDCICSFITRTVAIIAFSLSYFVPICLTNFTNIFNTFSHFPAANKSSYIPKLLLLERTMNKKEHFRQTYIWMWIRFAHGEDLSFRNNANRIQTIDLHGKIAIFVQIQWRSTNTQISGLLSPHKSKFNKYNYSDPIKFVHLFRNMRKSKFYQKPA